jgi:hypothetical protein
VPALPNQPNILKVQYKFTVGEDLGALCRRYLHYSGAAPSPSTCAAIAAAIYASWVTQFQALLNAANAITEVLVTDLSTPTAGFGTHSAITNGGEVSLPVPSGAALLENLGIPRRYRGGKPRIYWPLFSASDLQDATTWKAASLTAAQLAEQLHVNDMFAIAIAGTTIDGLRSISYYNGFTPVLNPITGRTRDVPKVRAAAIAPDVVGTFSFNRKVASQRRRNLHSA